MAPRKASTTPERPAEALSLTNAIKRTTPWPAYSEVARWPRPGRMVIADMNGARPAASQRSAAYNERRRLLKACEAELFAAWEAGTTSWFGRVGSSSASYQVIPSSAARYVRINWRRLIACETVTGTVIFDIRIAPAEVATKAPRRQQQRAAAVVIRQSRARIIDALKASPTKPSHSKAELRTECQKQFKATWRDFEVAWKEAIKTVPQATSAWTKAGRRR